MGSMTLSSPDQRTDIFIWSATAALLFGVNSSHALSISTEDLPTSILNQTWEGGCINSNCVRLNSTTSLVELPHLSAFTLNRAGETHWLIRYNLTTASNRTSIDTGESPHERITPYSGHLWLEAPTTLNSTGQNLFRIYTDKITPDPTVIGFDDPGSMVIFDMPTADALNGAAGYYSPSCDEWCYETPSGNLNLLQGLQTCVECGSCALLRLIGIQYLAAGAYSEINTSDTRGLLLSYGDFYNTWETTNSFYVQAVPVSGAVWLLGSGLLMLGGAARRKIGI